MKRLLTTIVVICCFVFFTEAQAKISFFEEHIDFSLENNYFTINGIFSFANKNKIPETQQIIFPFANETDSIDSIRIINLNTLNNLDFIKLKSSVVFKITVPANDTVDLNIFYRQKKSSTNKYIITSTQSWGKPLNKAVYSLSTEKELKIKSFTYQPDTIKTINNKKIYLWYKTEFMPLKDFEIILND
ncbi:MAG: hypothetical protein PHS59_18240 [Paludibacter sp.]|nr:hypothetical protein [Paludibacter sp.]